MLLGVDRLAAEKDHAMRVEGGADVGDHAIGEGLRQVDPVNLGADRTGDGADFKRVAAHPMLLVTGER